MRHISHSYSVTAVLAGIPRSITFLKLKQSFFFLGTEHAQEADPALGIAEELDRIKQVRRLGFDRDQKGAGVDDRTNTDLHCQIRQITVSRRLAQLEQTDLLSGSGFAQGCQGRRWILGDGASHNQKQAKDSILESRRGDDICLWTPPPHSRPRSRSCLLRHVLKEKDCQEARTARDAHHYLQVRQCHWRWHFRFIQSLTLMESFQNVT